MTLRHRCYIFADAGADFSALEETLIAFSQRGPRRLRVERMTAAQILEGALLRGNLRRSTFFMPGAPSALPYFRALGEQGIKSLQEYVREGGCYTGFCAGKYFACRFSFRDEPHLDPRTGDFGLRLMAGEARGPYYSGAPHTVRVQGMRFSVSQVVFEAEGRSQSAEVLYMDGPSYHPDPKIENGDVRALACFADIQETPIAAVSKPYGQGRVVLSGVHPEYRAAQIRPRLHIGSALAEGGLKIAERLGAPDNDVQRDKLLRVILNESISR